MKLNASIVCLFICCCLTLDGVDGGNTPVCNSAFLCLQTFQQGVNSTLYSTYNITFPPNSVDDYKVLATRDELCKASNQDVINCLLVNLTACPSIIYADTLLVDLDTVNTTILICSNLQTQACTARERIFKTCYDDILPEIETGQGSPTTIFRTCLTEYRDQMTCLMDSYKDCDSVIFQDGLENFDLLKDEIFLNQWKSFNNAEEICSCAIKSVCQTAMDNRLFQYAFRRYEGTLEAEYSKVLGYGEDLCFGKSEAQCAYTGFSPLCSITEYSARVTNFKKHYDFTRTVCTGVESQEFKDNKACIISQLETKLAFCKNVLPADARNLNCIEMDYLYRCFEVALDGICGNVTTTVYEIFREFYGLSDCPVPSSGIRVPSSLQTIVLISVIYVNYVLQSNLF